jgi:hypothetical protein
MAVQILAVHLEAASAETIMAITEVVWRQDESGKCSGLSRQGLGEWMDRNPTEIVYVRDHLGNVARVQSFKHEEKIFLKTSGDTRDSLLTLPRYITETM